MCFQQGCAYNFHLCLGMAARQVQNSQTSSIGLLWIRSGLQHGSDVRSGMRPDFGCFSLEPISIRVQDKLVVGRHMFWTSGKTSLCQTVRVDCHLLPMMEDSYQAFGGTDLDFLVYQCMWNAVVVSLKGNMIVNIHPDILPDRKLIRTFRQWT